MRTPWVLFVVFAVGAAAGAATAVLLRPEVAPAPAPASAPAASESGSTWNPEPFNTAVPEAVPSFQRFTPPESELERASANPGVPRSPVQRTLRTPGLANREGINLLHQLLMKGARQEPPRSDGEAESALRRIVAAPASEAVQEDRGEMFTLASQLVGAGRDTGPLAEEFLKSPDAEVRRAGVSLAQGTSPRVDLLLAACSDPDSAVRTWALNALDGQAADGRVSPREVEPIVFAALQDPASEARVAAMGLLRWCGAPGAAEAARILRAGEHREIEAGPAALVEAALSGAAAALLADPLPQHLAEDICGATSSLTEDRPDLVRALAPHAASLIRALPPGARDAAAGFLDALGVVGEAGVLRQVLLDPGLSPRIRAKAAGPLARLFPPGEWETAVSGWLRDAAVDLEVRRDFLAEHASSFPRSEEDGDAAYEAWTRILRALARGTDDPALSADAQRTLEDIAIR